MILSIFSCASQPYLYIFLEEISIFPLLGIRLRKPQFKKTLVSQRSLQQCSQLPGPGSNQMSINREMDKEDVVHTYNGIFSSVQFSPVAQSCPTLCNPMNRSTPGLPVHHQLPEFTETHVHQVSDAIQPSHLLSSPSPPAPNPSQHQSLFQ